MTSMKGEGSSRCKGKEIAIDDPPTKAVGEKATLSQSECSEEEERSRNPNSKCSPLINPWYDTHTHFLVIPGDYLPPPLSRVWLSIFHHDTEVSWAPLASSIPDLDIHQGTSLPMPIFFEFRSSTSLGWKEWVMKSCSIQVSWQHCSRPAC